MSDLNDFIAMSQKYSRPASPDTVPVIDRSQHVNLGLEIAQRSGQLPEPVVAKPMLPIVPVAN